MTTYELMIKTNHYLIKGGQLTAAQKQNIVGQFLSAVTSKEQANRFYKGLKYPNNIDDEGRRMYPVYFIPPYNNGKKFSTVMCQKPKTHILSANSYELEIIRLLHIFKPSNHIVKDMVEQTLDRLKTTCFGYKNCSLGECFDASFVVLRFLACVAPEETAIKGRINNYRNHFSDKRRHWSVKWYFWLCLSELPLEIAESEILKCKDDILTHLDKGCAIHNDFDDSTNIAIISVLRNTISRLPEYEFIMNREPFVNDTNSRLYIDISS